jgi:hypothetical protein
LGALLLIALTNLMVAPVAQAEDQDQITASYDEWPCAGGGWGRRYTLTLTHSDGSTCIRWLTQPWGVPVWNDSGWMKFSGSGGGGSVGAFDTGGNLVFTMLGHGGTLAGENPASRTIDGGGDSFVIPASLVNYTTDPDLM